MNFQNCWPCFSLIELNFQFVFGVFDLRFELLALQNRTDRIDGVGEGAVTAPRGPPAGQFSSGKIQFSK